MDTTFLCIGIWIKYSRIGNTDLESGSLLNSHRPAKFTQLYTPIHYIHYVFEFFVTKKSKYLHIPTAVITESDVLVVVFIR